MCCLIVCGERRSSSLVTVSSARNVLSTIKPISCWASLEGCSRSLLQSFDRPAGCLNCCYGQSDERGVDSHGHLSRVTLLGTFLLLSVCLPACLYACLPVCLSICLSGCLSGCLFVCLFVCSLVCLFVLSIDWNIFRNDCKLFNWFGWYIFCRSLFWRSVPTKCFTLLTSRGLGRAFYTESYNWVVVNSMEVYGLTIFFCSLRKTSCQCLVTIQLAYRHLLCRRLRLGYWIPDIV